MTKPQPQDKRKVLALFDVDGTLTVPRKVRLARSVPSGKNFAL
jgi:phosphoserine phosphatase